MILQLVKDMIYVFVKRIFVLFLVVGFFGFSPTAFSAFSVDYSPLLTDGSDVNSINVSGFIDARADCAINPLSGDGTIFYIALYDDESPEQQYYIYPQEFQYGVPFDVDISANTNWINGDINGFIPVNNSRDLNPELFEIMKSNGPGTWQINQQCVLLGENNDFSPLFNLLLNPVAVAPIPLSFSILPTTTQPTDLVASVVSGVQTTGTSIWPLFAFVGISLAFVIALQVVVFTRRAVLFKKTNKDT